MQITYFVLISTLAATLLTPFAFRAIGRYTEHYHTGPRDSRDLNWHAEKVRIGYQLFATCIAVYLGVIIPQGWLGMFHGFAVMSAQIGAGAATLVVLWQTAIYIALSVRLLYGEIAAVEAHFDSFSSTLRDCRRISTQL